MTCSVHCTFSCVLQIDTIHSSPGEPMFSCNATMQGSLSSVIDSLEYHDTMSVAITYYNVFNETFLENAMNFCIGSLLVTEEDSADPSLTVHSYCLIRFVARYHVPIS